MKRLTKRTVAGTANIDYEGCTFPNGEEDYIAKSARRQLAIDRLAAIEDILCDGENEYDLDRLRELVEVRDTLKEFAEDVARQFGYRGTTPDGRAAYTTGGLSTLEWAWSLLGWPDPKPAPECECQEEDCHEWASGGRPTPDGYKWLCSRHYLAYEAREEALNAREQNG